MTTLIIAIGGFAFILAAIIAIRAKSQVKFEIRNPDIVLALIPVVLWLFLTGKIQEFTIGELKIVSAIVKASESPVAPQVSVLPVEAIRTDMKAGLEMIPRLIRNKTQGLSFELGHGEYWGPAIKEYLEALGQYPFFRYLIFNDVDGRFLGIVEARQFPTIARGPEALALYDELAEWLNSSNISQLEALPGFLSSKNALREISDKRRALQLMDSLNVESLPVIAEDGRFIGLVDRSRLTASMLIDISERIEKEK